MSLVSKSAGRPRTAGIANQRAALPDPLQYRRDRNGAKLGRPASHLSAFAKARKGGVVPRGRGEGPESLLDEAKVRRDRRRFERRDAESGQGEAVAVGVQDCRR